MCKLRSDMIKEMNEYMENTKVYTALNCCLKITMPNLHKIGLKMRELCFKNLAPLRVGPRASLHYPPPPQESVPLGHIFFLTGHEWSLTCSSQN